MEVTNCDTCQRTNCSNKKYGKETAREAEEIPWNKRCVDPIGPYITIKKVREKLNLNSVAMIYPVTGWFKTTQYDDKRAIYIANLVKPTWLTRYPRPIEIMYDQGSEFIVMSSKKFYLKTNMR